MFQDLFEIMNCEKNTKEMLLTGTSDSEAFYL